MPGVYDDENEDLDSLTSDESGNAEQSSADADQPEDEGAEKKPDTGIRSRFGAGLHKRRQEAQDADDKHWEETKGNLDSIHKKMTDEGAASGFYRPGKGMTGKRKSLIGAARGTFRNKGMVAGIGGGIIGVVVGFAMLFNFLHTFQLDHFFKNVEEKTTTRLSASLDSRNKYLTQSYIRIRATEIQGGAAGDNLYFKAVDKNGNPKIDTGNPMRDWYSSMRASKFETDLQKRYGITFVSMVDANGNISPAKVTQLKDANPKLMNQYGLDDPKLTPGQLTDKLNGIKQDDLEKMFTVDSFDSHKAARASVKSAVNEAVPWWQVFKRRHLRADIANDSGIKSWRLFENTRDKIAKNKQAVKDKLLNKIIEKYYADNPASAQFMKCLFSNGRCSTSSDPSDPANETATPEHGGTPDELASPDQNPSTTDAKGNTVPGDTLATSEAGDAAETAIQDSVKREAEGAATDAASQELVKLGPTQQIILAMERAIAGDTVSDAIPVNPTKIWTWAKRIAKIDAILGTAAGASKLETMVYNARSSQLEGIYTTYQIAADQMKSGQLVGDELNAFFDSTKNLGNTEGWQTVTGELNSGKVSAEPTTNMDKKTYCDPNNPSKPRENPNLFAWMCDDQKPGGTSTAQTISDSYANSVGPIVKPIADSVNTVQDSVVGTVVDWATNFVNNIAGKVTEPVVSAVLSGTGLDKTITAFTSTVMEKLVGFLGAGPMFDGTQPGLGNLLVAGAATSAENSTRGSGGIKSTKQSLAYSNNLAQQYQANQTAQESLTTRYASLNNPDSLASNALFAVSTDMNLSQIASKVGGYFSSIPSLVGDVFSGQAFAQPQQDGSAVAKWANVNTYDIPQICIDLDPLDPDYLSKSSNIHDIIGVSPKDLGWDTMRNSTAFWKAVYDKLGDDPNAEAKADKIYNCALLDARSMGDVGYTYGYNKDNGYGSSNNSTAVTPSQSAACSPPSSGASSTTPVAQATGNASIPCQGEKYVGLPYSHQGVHSDGGAEGYRQRCPDSKIPSDHSCGIDCSAFVSVMLYDAFGSAPGFPKNISLYVSTSDGTLINQTSGSGGASPLFKEIPLTSIQPGDILTMPDHTSVVKSYDASTGKLNTIESVGGGSRLGPNDWTWGSIGEEGFNRAWRYIGPGSTGS